jgi:hypothetical protein
MTRRIHRKLLIATLFLGATAALAACGAGSDSGSDSGTNTGAGAPAAPATQTTEPSTASPVAPPNAPPIAEPTAEPTAATEPSASTTPTQRPAGVAKAYDGCPVSGSTLLKIIRRYDDFVATTAMTDVKCYDGWAVARQQVAPEYQGKVQPVTALFRYDAKYSVWTYVTAGTGGICPGSMPTDVQKRFEVCRG